MNEKINIWVISTIILVIIGIILGLRNCNDSGTIRELEENGREIRKEIHALRISNTIITGISEGYKRHNTRLRNSITELERDKEQYRTDLDNTYTELEKTTEKLRKVEQQLTERNKRIAEYNTAVKEEIGNLREIITEIENEQDP